MAGIAKVNEKFLAHLLKGDERCKYPIGSRVMKMDSEEKDLHTPGTQGKVIGNLYDEELGAGYLVNFDGTPAPTFLMGTKLMGL